LQHWCHISDYLADSRFELITAQPWHCSCTENEYW